MPATLFTDRQRLEQILKNLLSNAIKFTERGQVSLNIGYQAGTGIVFAVRDTGIGIAADQQQASSKPSARPMAPPTAATAAPAWACRSRATWRICSAADQRRQQPRQGSVFTLILPSTTSAGRDVEPQPAPGGRRCRRRRRCRWRRAKRPAGVCRRPRARAVRQPLHPGGRGRAELRPHPLRPGPRTGLQLPGGPRRRRRLRAGRPVHPDAILLDMRLPDHSGLTVLQRLKEQATRHIPVHVISVEDRVEAAMHMGAVGYAVKPTSREELKDVFARLEAKLTQKLKRVLLVEDDDLQRDSIARLIGDDDIEITAVAMAQDALALLRENIYDCMIIDLKLPDMLGNELLKRMTAEDIRSFPPVIVYTGRNLTREEEADLRKYSRSIIIKGARSPERLLDEVTLFLHKVESQLSNERQRMLKTARSRDKVFEGRKVLLVDDDVRNIFALTSALEHKGASWRSAATAVKPSSAWSSDDIDLVLMDVMMPEMDGFEATRLIRQHPRWRKLPIIAVTAKAMKDDQQRCLQAGANDYLAKPIDLDRLFSLIRVWLPKMERI
jgi:CheY-like chemotaxis protein